MIHGQLSIKICKISDQLSRLRYVKAILSVAYERQYFNEHVLLCLTLLINLIP